jgi:type IV pilus assembly protein PilX
MKTALDYAPRPGARTFRQRQQGITLIIALLVLVSMTLAGVALMRSVDSSTLLAGNLAFRQSATASADRGMEGAIAVLRGMSATGLQSDGAAGSGYYAALPATDKDFTGSATPATSGDDFDWDKDAAKIATADAAGNTVAYVVHRLCQGAGALNVNTCTTWLADAEGGASTSSLVGGETYRDPTLTPKPSAMRGFYRITVRIAGPRNTYSYVQASVVI